MQPRLDLLRVLPGARTAGESEQRLSQRFPRVCGEIKRIISEGGKIVEHWDVRQPMPGTSSNRNGMF